MRKIFFSLVMTALVLPTWGVSALPSTSPQPTPGEIINRINNYRASNGLPPYQSNTTLMQLAQGQADYQASIETVTHTGPGGTRPIDRAYAVGYGNGNTVFVSEIIYGGYTATVEIAITWWKGSTIHNNTMLASTYQEIGAGVASSGDRMFFTAVTGYVVGAPAPANAIVSSPLNDEDTIPDSEAPSVPALIIVPVTISDPQEDGSIVHTVRTGQALWNIAAVYNVSLEEVLEINNLPQNAIIFPGDEILVQTAPEPPVEPPSALAQPSTPPAPLATSEAAEAPPPPEEPEVKIASNTGPSPGADAIVQVPATTGGLFQGSTARWIVVIAFGGLLAVLGTSLVLQQRTVEQAPSMGNPDPLSTSLSVTLSTTKTEKEPFELLTKEEQVERLQRLGEVAVMAYPLDAGKIIPLHYRMNASFKIEARSSDGPEYLMQIHLPGVHTRPMVRSKMVWLDFLQKQSNMHAPKPVKKFLMGSG